MKQQPRNNGNGRYIRVDGYVKHKCNACSGFWSFYIAIDAKEKKMFLFLSN